MAAQEPDYDTRRPVDLVALTPAEWELWTDGYQTGVQHGIDMGREQADAEAEARHRQAVKVVRVMADLDPWPVHAEKVRQRQLEAAARYEGAA